MDALLKNGDDAELVIFPGEGHGWRKAKTMKESLQRMLEFFNRVLSL